MIIHEISLTNTLSFHTICRFCSELPVDIIIIKKTFSISICAFRREAALSGRRAALDIRNSECEILSVTSYKFKTSKAFADMRHTSKFRQKMEKSKK